jgi:hypothetical protein
LLSILTGEPDPSTLHLEGESRAYAIKGIHALWRQERNDFRAQLFLDRWELERRWELNYAEAQNFNRAEARRSSIEELP